MTEQNKEVLENKDTEQTQNKTQETPEYTDVELKALEMGWRPKEEFEGDEDDFIDAKEFVRRKPLFDKIETQSKELKNVKRAIEALQKHYTAREEAAVKNAISQLKVARKEALTNGDGEAFEQIDDQIKQAEKEADRLKKIEQETNVQTEVHPEFVAWTKRNSWYKDVGYMRKWADDYGIELAQQGLSPSDVLKKVEQAVKKEFAHKFTNPNKASAPDVEGSGRAGSSKGIDRFELTDNERKIMNTLVSTKQMTKEEYIKQLKEMYPERAKK